MSFDQSIMVWSVVGTWLAAIGTVSAAVTALWLARRADRVRLKIWVGHAVHTGSGDEYLRFAVTNVGERPVTVDALGWRATRWGRTKKEIGMLDPDRGQIPFRIAHGESDDVMWGFAAWLATMRRLFPAEELRTVRAFVHTSTGHKETIEIDALIRDRLIRD